jgi:uncharacterized protein (TIGR00297 family)
MAVGALLILLLSILAYRFRAMDALGLAAGGVMGLIILYSGGWAWLTLLLAFFVVASLATKYRYSYRRKHATNEEKNMIRGWPNTLANGGIATVAAIIELYRPSGLWAAMFLGAVGTALGDTLATELGLLSKSKPRRITDLKPVEPGTSGGITPLGLTAQLAGPLFLGATALAVGFRAGGPLGILLPTVVGGFSGGCLDSLIGATIQGVNRCQVCGRMTEALTHHGKPTRTLQGVRAIDNNMVNFLATLFGGLVGMALYLGLQLG